MYSLRLDRGRLLLKDGHMTKKHDAPASDDEVRAALAAGFHAEKAADAGRVVWRVACRSCRCVWSLPFPTVGEIAELLSHAAEHEGG